MDKEGKTPLETRAMKGVRGQEIENGFPWPQRAFVADDWYITVKEPIRDIEDKIVRMLCVGMLESKDAAIQERIILLS